MVYLGSDSRQEWFEEFYCCPACDKQVTRRVTFKTQSEQIDKDELIEMNGDE
jgi:hypothetical protein